MRIVHVTPHLGGGVGKAHAALSAAIPRNIERRYLLLEEPQNRRYADIIAAHGIDIEVANGLHHIAAIASTADIVQFEFWNHPRLFECLARCAFAPMRSVFWSHISGLAPPVVPSGLIDMASRFVFTTEASLGIAQGERITTINSGFGFSDVRPVSQDRKPVIAYLGTVDFIKMHRDFFEVIDRLQGEVEVRVYGAFDRQSAVAHAVRAMRYPMRVTLCDETQDPIGALRQADIFFYPLRPDHFGTAENALVEAMSLGLVPVVMRNPAEMAIVRHGETGLAAYSTDHCVSLLQSLLDSAVLRQRLSTAAVQDMARTRSAERSAAAFVDLWQGMMREPPRPSHFAKILGLDVADWFAATQMSANDGEKAAKGTLAHFESVFAGDESLARLRA